MGIAMRDGIRLAAREINEGRHPRAAGAAGRAGRRGPPRARRPGGAGAHQPEKIVAGLGIVNTGVALASQRFYQQAHIPMITSVATGSIITKQFLPPQYPDNYIFRVSAPDTVQAAMIVEEAVVRRACASWRSSTTAPTTASSAVKTWSAPSSATASSRWPSSASTSATWT
jgi:branched-chain amino acid transport system substrate-binding protein